MGNRPVGEGLTGRGMEHPPPLSHASPVERFSLEHPHRPARSAPPPAPWKGAGSEWRLARIECTGSGGRIFGGCQVRPRRDCQIPGSASMGYHPAGVGLTGRGWNIPLPCLLSQPLNGFRWITPTSRRVPRLLPPPGRGRAVSGDWPGGRARGRDRISAGCSHQAVEMLFPGSASMGYHPVGVGLTGRGWNIPLPQYHASPVERFPLDHPHLPARSAPPPAPYKGAGS